MSSLFAKALAVVESCSTLRQLELAYGYLTLASKSGLEYSSVAAVYEVLADKWKAIAGPGSTPKPIGPVNRIYSELQSGPPHPGNPSLGVMCTCYDCLRWHGRG